MGSFSNYVENKILDYVFSAAAFTVTGPWYIALCTSAPSDSSTGSTIVEPSGNNYSRLSVTNDATQWPAASGGSKSNGATLTFPQASGSWGTITHVAICDASTAGNVLAYGTLTTSKTVDSGDTVSFAAAALVITLD